MILGWSSWVDRPEVVLGCTGVVLGCSSWVDRPGVLLGWYWDGPGMVVQGGLF